MKRIHVPQVNARYWTAITLASIFGTNMGDFYAHESGLGIVKGLIVLAVLAALVFIVERLVESGLELYYWLVIILVRTGATNIADYFAFRVRVPPLTLSLSLIALLCFFGWGTHKSSQSKGEGVAALPATNTAYWLAMLTAGVFGTVVGDISSHWIGQGPSSLLLGVVLLIVLALGRGRVTSIIALYWATVAVARTAGTAMGDWLVENTPPHIGLSLSTLITGIAFVAVLLLWQRQPKTS